MSLDVHIVANGTLLPLMFDGLAINNVQLQLIGDQYRLYLIGQLFNATELTIFDSWFSDRIHWHVRSRFVIEATFDASFTQLFSCLNVNVLTHATFVTPSRDYGRVTAISEPMSAQTAHKFCNVCVDTAPRKHVQLTLCSVIRDEAKNLNEWLTWHELLGVERFVLYDDASSDATRAVLASRIARGVVQLVDWSYSNYWRQLSAINDCLLSHSDDTDWLGAIDLDEFLFPPHAAVANYKIVDVLHGQRFENVAAIRIAWLQFSDRVEPEDEAETSTVGRYVWCVDKPYLGTMTLLEDSAESVKVLAGKSLFRPQQVVAMDTSHFPTLIADTAMKVVDADPSDELLIRHYAMRDAGARNRWDDTRHWKARHHDQLQKLFGTTKDSNAQRLAREVESIAL